VKRASSFARIFAVSVLSIGALAASSRGATFTWSGAGILPPFNNNHWLNLFNWDGNVTPPNNGTADVVIPDTARDNPEVDVPWSIDTLAFQGGATNLSLNDQPLIIAGGITNLGSGKATINNALVAASDQTWSALNGPLVINGAISGSNVDLFFEGGHTITFDGAATNTFNDSYRVSSGTLVLSRSSANAAVAGDLIIGGSSGAANSAIVHWDNSEQVSDAAGLIINVNKTGKVELNNRIETVDRMAVIGTVESNGGKLVLTNRLTLGGGTVSMGAGELVVGSFVNNNVFNAQSTITASLLRLNSPQTDFQAGGGTAPVAIEVNAVIADSSSGAAILRKSDDGRLRLTGANTYTGGTVVEEGVLALDNSTGSGAGPGEVTVLGGRLEGNGSASGSVLISNGAMLAPGSPIGSLEVGSLNLGAGSATQFQIGGVTPGVSHDVVPVAGAASLNGTLSVVLAGFSPTASQTFTLLSSSNLLGSFLNAPSGSRLATTDGSGSFVVNYGAGSPFGASNVVLSAFRLAGDFDEDRDVDLADFNKWKVSFGTATGAAHLQGDANGDGDVDSADLFVWQRQFGSITPLAVAIPEPGGAFLGGVSLLFTWQRRWRRSAA
jgi:autotransporter-associated beta strand protein